MGDVGDGRDRAQMILLTGFAIAISLVALVMLLNTMIYTQNLATREVDIGGSDALEAERTVRVATGGIMVRENDRDYGTYNSLLGVVTENVSGVEDVIRDPMIRRSRIVDIDESGITDDEGKRLKQTTETRNFTDTTGLLNDWDLAYDIDATRNAEFVVDRASLNSTSDPVGDDAFEVQLTENASLTSWSVYIYENGGEIAIGTVTPSSGFTQHCTLASDTAVIDLSAGTINGTPCTGYQWAAGLSGGYDIAFVNGDEATGTYGMTVNTETSGVVNPITLNDGPSSGPYYVPAVYSAQVPVTFETSRVRYENTIRVAPGEPDG